MHHYGFMRGNIDEERDEFHVVLFNAETEGELMISGKVSKILNVREGGTLTPEYVGDVIAGALNYATRYEGEAMT
jgi:hypothetical protein